MPSTLGALRRFVLTPSFASVTFAKRRFAGAASANADAERIQHLEAIPESVICGFEWGIEARTQWEIERRLSLVEPAMRGFAYEGATMALTVRDAMAAGRGHRTRDLLMGPGQPHIFLAYIGIGFAMARLPRALWKNVLPDLGETPYYPTMSWLAVDGYAFDRAYFDTRKWVDEQHVPRPYPWLGSPDYFLRAVDQGIGRALWFIHAAEVDAVAAAVGRFPGSRQADLWSGVGLAATFAGGQDAEGLARLRAAAGGYRAEMAMGAVFAATARAYSGHVPPHSESTLTALTDLSVVEAATLAIETGNDLEDPTRTGVPPYEVWRRRVHARFAADPARREQNSRAG